MEEGGRGEGIGGGGEEENRVSKKQVSLGGEKPISGRFVSIMEIVVSQPVVVGVSPRKVREYE